MKKVELKIDAQSAEFSDQKVIKLSLDSITVKELLPVLFLLHQELILNAEIVCNNFSLFIKRSEKDSVCTLENIRKGISKISISLDDLEYIIHYLLRYFRDGIADAEHIDVDFPVNKSYIFTVTITLDNINYISESEMNKMLNI